MADERLYQFPSKPTPVPADIVYLGDSAAAFNEVQSTIEEIIGAYPGLLSMGDQSVIANQILYTTGVDTWAPTPITAFGRSLIQQVDVITTQALLEVVPGTDVEAWSAALDSIAALTTAADQMIYTTGANTYATTTLTAVARTMLAQSSNANILMTIGAVPLAGGTMTGSLILNADPAVSLGAATKQYVDNAVAGAVSQFVVRLATTINASFTYANGSSGVGATLTAGAPGTIVLDGTNVALNDYILFKNQSSTFQNGIYQCTNDGSVTAAVFTRPTFYDQPAEIQPGDLVTVSAGSTNAQTSWRQTSTVTTIGTDPITFLQYTVNPANYLQVANNLSDLGSASTARTNLGLGTAAVQNVTAFLQVANNLSDLTAKQTANNNLVAVYPINVVTNLGNVDWGKTVVCTGATSYPLTMTGTHVANQWIDILVQTTSNALVTLGTAIGGTFNGQTSILLAAGDAVRVWDDGTNYWVIAINMQPVNFTAYRNATQSITTGSAQKVNLNATTRNIGGFFDNVTNFRFLPRVPGLYQINVKGLFGAFAGASFSEEFYIMLNASTILGTAHVTMPTNNSTFTQNLTAFQYFNGITDYVELFAFQNSGSSINVLGDATPSLVTTMTGSRISLF